MTPTSVEEETAGELFADGVCKKCGQLSYSDDCCNWCECGSAEHPDDLDLSWISAETESKERDFRGLFRMHATICSGILRRFSRRPYLYADLYAGPGPLEFQGRQFPGSPLIATEELAALGLSYEALFFERDPAVARSLSANLPDVPEHTVYPQDCQTGFADWLKGSTQQSDRYGLVYADPIHDEIPYALLNKVKDKFPRVDLLSYFSATQYKRRRGADQRANGTSFKPLVSQHIASIKKTYALIRVPRSAWQFSFVFWTDWPNFPDWKRAGFYRLDSPEGQDVLDRMDFTASEYLDRLQMPLL